MIGNILRWIWRMAMPVRRGSIYGVDTNGIIYGVPPEGTVSGINYGSPYN